MKNFILSWALLLRLVLLRMKPPHFDESINGWFVMQIWQNGFFTYDPSNFHGPLYFYFLQFCQLLIGPGILALRLGTALLSVGCVAMVAAHRRFFGKPAIWAAAIMALSPAFVFYGRYAIHESLFILAQIIFSYGFWLYRETKSVRAIGLMLIGFTAALCTKETFFIFFITWGLALLCLQIFDVIELQFRDRVAPQREWPSLRQLSHKDKMKLTIYVALSVFAVVCLFTGFFNDQRGVIKFFEAFMFWTKTGSGHTGHEKPFYYWFKLMARYEWPALVAVLTMPLLFVFQFSREARFWGLLGLGLLLAYSLIPYKTPWCGVNFLWPLSLSLGFLTTEFKQKVMSSVGVVRRSRVRSYHSWRLALTLTLIFSLVRTLQLNFRDYADPKEPYVYVQSTEDINIVTRLIARRIAYAPEDQNMRIEIATEESWPFPWILGNFPHARFGKFVKTDPLRLDNADVIFFDERDKADIDKFVHKKYLQVSLHYREAYQRGFAYLNADKFAVYLPTSTTVINPSRGQP